MNLPRNRVTASGAAVWARERAAKRLALIARLAGCLWSLGAIANQDPVAEPVSTLQQYYALSTEQALEGRALRLQGIVLSYDLGWGQLYVHDGSQAGWFDPREFSTQPRVGQLVEISGQTHVVEGAKGLTNLTLSVLGQGTPPKAIPLLLSQLASEFGQWVEVRGKVRAVDSSSGRLALVLHDAGRSGLVYIMGDTPETDGQKLLGCTVRIRGINASKLVGGQLDSASMFAPGMDALQIIDTAMDFAPPPVVSINSVLNRELGDWTNSPVSVSGLVVSYQPGRSLVVRDPTGVLRAQIVQASHVRVDERVNVRGFLSVAPAETVLRDAFFEVLKPANTTSPVPPKPDSLPGDSVPPEELAHVSDIRKLRSHEAANSLPVRLTGVLTYADPEWQNGFLQDETGGIYFDLNQPGFRVGQWIELTGSTSPGGFAPQVANPVIRVLGSTNLPAPARVNLTDLADGHLDAHWVEMEGVVRGITQEEGHLTLSLMTRRGRFKAIIPDFHNEVLPTYLIDSLVGVRGACTSEMNARRQLSGVTLHVPTLDQIEMIEPAPADPFAGPLTPIAAVATFDPDRLAGRRVKVSGVVTLRIPDQGFFVQGSTAGIWVFAPSETSEFEEGDLVDVLGFPTLGDFSPTIEQAVIRKTGVGPIPPPRESTAESILLNGDCDGQIVSITARLLQDIPRSASPQLVLQDGSIIFTARIEGTRQERRTPSLESGSLLRVTGICSIQGGERHEPIGFRLLIGSTGDVLLISRPLWWTARRTLWAFGGLGAALLIALTWVSTLRNQVRRQTRKLRLEIAEREKMGLKMEQTHKDLLAASRQAGMAEVATSVLHNVGNVLNSVNTSAAVVADRLGTSRIDGIARVADLLKQHKDDLPGFFAADGRGRHMINFLEELGQHLGAEQAEVCDELAELTKNIEHIKEIVAMQQNYARVSGLTETVKATDLIEDALRMNERALTRHNVELSRDYPRDVPEITVEKHKVLQILVNLIHNAKYACTASGRTDKRVAIRVSNGDANLQITVTDNGVGIPHQNLTRIFSHGFTTRKTGHGFGLHSGALAAREMGGALSAHSDGPGLGASFTLQLPLHRIEA